MNQSTSAGGAVCSKALPCPSPWSDELGAMERFVLSLRGRDWKALSLADQERALDSCFRYWRQRGFPYYRLTEAQMRRDYERLVAADPRCLVIGTEIQMSMVGVRLANHFHPQMWSVRIAGARSPMERFSDDSSLRRVLRRALSVWPDLRAVNECNLRRMLKTFSNTAGVSNFRPTAAKTIYATYSRPGDRVLDFSSGYGGRLLGCLTLDRDYVGVDPCGMQVRGLTMMLDTVGRITGARTNATVHQACAEDYLASLPSSSMALVFSSPPYFDYERYSDEPSQSYRRYPVYEQWRDAFLAAVVRESGRLLVRGGFLVINVANCNGLNIVDDFLRVAADAGLALQHVRTLRLGRKPYLRREVGQAFKHEPVFVFQKAPRGYGNLSKCS